MSKLFAVIAFLKSICSVNIILADVEVMVMMAIVKGVEMMVEMVLV